VIEVSYQKPNFILQFPYAPQSEDLKVVRLLPVRQWVKKKKIWTVPELAVATIENIPRSHWTEEAIKRGVQIKKAILELVDYKFQSNNHNGHDYLRPYQHTGVDFLTHAKKALLADDMGLGKSLQAIQTLINLQTESNLILCPATLKLNWHNEFQKHFGIEPVVVSGKKKERLELWNSGNPFVIANYDILSRDWNDIPKKWDAVVCDEAVYLKTHKAMRTKLVKKLKSDVRIGLSGMPMENNLMEFHSILEWIRPEVLPIYNRFKYRYIDFGWDGKISGYKNLEELHLLTSPYILRRKKEDVLKELPPKIHTDFPLELDKKAKEAYLALCNEFWEWLREQTGKNIYSSALEKMIRLRQFVEFPEIIGFDALANVKLEWLKDIYSDVDKLVVFTYFRGSVDRLAKEFNTDYILTGGTPTDQRIEIVDKFNAADKGMFILTDAGKFGINITGCSNVAQYGLYYNPATMVQREDRLHRFGQKNTVHVMTPYIARTIDEGIRKIFHKRGQEAADFMDGSEKMSVSRMSKEDFRRMVVGG
jgi:SNF2 family DNA or RNA helicase